MAEHIKVPAQTPRIVYNAPAGTSSLVIPFMFFSPSDIIVTVNGIVYVLNVHYQVIATGGFEKGFPGGVVAFFAALTAPSSIVVIRRRVPIARNVDFPNAGPLQTVSLNTELDKIIAIIQDNKAEFDELEARIDIIEQGDPRVGRALLFPPEDSGPDINKSLPAIGDRSNRLLGFKTDGNIQMFAGFVFSPAEPRNNAIFPSPAGRANKVIGFDAGGEPSYTSVVAGTLVPDADNIEYTAPIPTPAVRSVANRLAERLSIKDFGPNVGNGLQSADDAALAAAITFLNTLPAGSDFFHTIYYPDGIYFHGPCAVTLTHGNVCLKGNSEASSQISFIAAAPGDAWLKIGAVAQPRTEHIYIESLAFDVSGDPNNTLLNLANSYDVRLRDLLVKNISRLLILGAGTATLAGAYRTEVSTVRGSSRNSGLPMFDFRFGGGLTVRGCQMTIEGATNPAATLDGTNVCTLHNAEWAGVYISGCLFSFYDIALRVETVAIPSACTELTLTDSVFSSLRSSACVLTQRTGTIIHRVRLDNNNIECLLGHGVNIFGESLFGLDDVFVRGNIMLNIGISGVVINTVAAENIVITDNSINNCGISGGAAGAIVANTGGGFTICNNTGNFSHHPHSAQYGIYVTGFQNNYIVTGNRMQGGITTIDDNIPFQGTRRIHTNAYMITETNGVPFVGNNGFWFNTWPYDIELHFNGGDVTIVGVSQGQYRMFFMTGGVIMLRPGESIQLLWNSPPFITKRHVP